MHTSYQTQTRNKPIQQNEKLTMNVVAPRLQMHQIYVTTLRKKACTMEHTYVPRRPCWHWYIAWSNWFAPKTVKPASQIGQLCIFYGCWLKISKNWAGPTLGLSPWLLQPLYRMWKLFCLPNIDLNILNILHTESFLIYIESWIQKGPLWPHIMLSLCLNSLLF